MLKQFACGRRSAEYVEKKFQNNGATLINGLEIYIVNICNFEHTESVKIDAHINNVNRGNGLYLHIKLGDGTA